MDDDTKEVEETTGEETTEAPAEKEAEE